MRVKMDKGIRIRCFSRFLRKFAMELFVQVTDCQGVAKFNRGGFKGVSGCDFLAHKLLYINLLKFGFRHKNPYGF